MALPSGFKTMMVAESHRSCAEVFFILTELGFGSLKVIDVVSVPYQLTNVPDST